MRVVLALSSLLVLVTIVVLIGRGICLFNLPDVGDPFDVATVPDDRDAFILFRQAQARLGPWRDFPQALRSAGPTVRWSNADATIRAWVEANREALAVFRQGAECHDGSAHIAADEMAFRCDNRLILGPLIWLALLEASRLEEEGDMAGACACYRAVLGMRAYVMRSGTASERLHAGKNAKALQAAVSSWCIDPRTRALDLRRALDDVLACAPRLEWESSSLKRDYLLAMRELDRPDGYVQQGSDEDRSYHVGGEPLPPNLAQSVYAFRRFLIREPERSRRVLRLVFANWLAHVQISDETHRKPAVRALLLSGGQKRSLFLYAAGPATQPAARALAPERLVEWLGSAPDAKLLLLMSQWPRPSIHRQEQAEHRSS